MLRIIALLGLWLAAGGLQARAKAEMPTTATPAVWTLKGGKADVVFLGSIHLLPPGLKWRNAAIDQALAKAEVVVFEAPIDSPMGGPGAELMARKGELPPGKTLRDILKPATWQRLRNAAWAVRFPAEHLVQFEPWMAAVTLEVSLYIHKGFSPWSGVDHLLEEEAEKVGKKLAYLETVEEQLNYLVKLPRAVGIRMLEATIEGIETEPELVLDLINAWAQGDANAMWRIVEDSMGKVPEVEDALLRQRNNNWVPKIDKMIKSGQHHLIVVGAAHLAGPYSVIAQLRKQGYTIEGP
ncbi:MAG TPA: hypothetical protein DCL54_06800 [Alphaproteobacteria bacterium]|nr:hypothetical protein [Alphaproteobacteria bacterium]